MTEEFEDVYIVQVGRNFAAINFIINILFHPNIRI